MLLNTCTITKQLSMIIRQLFTITRDCDYRGNYPVYAKNNTIMWNMNIFFTSKIISKGFKLCYRVSNQLLRRFIKCYRVNTLYESMCSTLY